MTTPLRGDATARARPAQAVVRSIDGLAAFAALKPAYDALHARDPEAGVFLSHGWLARLFAENPGQWRVLAVEDPDDPSGFAAFLPLRWTLTWSASRQIFRSDYAAAGRLCFSEYTGFVCAPGAEGWALPALGRHLAGLPFESLGLRYEPTVHRLETFAQGFGAGFDVRWPAHRINGGTTDQLVCPQIALPESFDAYLEAQSRNTRKKIRKTMRRYFDSGEVVAKRLEEVDYDTVTTALLDHWEGRWSAVNSARRLGLVRAKYARTLDRARDLGLLYLPSLWSGTRCLGALGFVVDRDAGAYHCMVTGRDTTVEDIDLGLLMHADAIADVIARGGRLYDFGHGDEAYKFHYATSTRKLGNLVVTRRDGPVFDPEQMSQALADCREMLARGKTENLEAALAQLSTQAGGKA